jgi:chromosome segregation ATPase
MSVWKKIEDLARKRKQCKLNLEKLDNALKNNEISKETYFELSESLKKEIEKYDKEIERLLDSVSRNLYGKLFGSDIDPEVQAYKKILEEVEELATEREYMNKKMERLKSEYEDKLNSLKMELERQRSENEVLQKKILELKNENIKLERELEKEKEKNEDLKRSINDLLKQMDTLLRKNDELSRVIEEAKRIKKDYEELKAIIELERTKRRIMKTSNSENSGEER